MSRATYRPNPVVAITDTERYTRRMPVLPLPASVLRFPCQCSPDAVAETKQLREFVKEKLRHRGSDADLMTSIVYSLEWDYRAYISNIMCDQWMGVSVKKAGEDDWSAFAQCDLLIDGFCAVWAQTYEAFELEDE